MLSTILEGFEYVAVGIEVVAVVLIVGTIATATIRYIVSRLQHSDAAMDYKQYRDHLGSGLLLGLEILVAADVIRTVALEQNLRSVATLGLLVLIRIILGWSIVVEIEGRWPWQGAGNTKKERSETTT